MTALPTLRDILNNTPANAVDVDWNFDTLASFVGQELINRDGSVAMNTPLTLAGPAPTSPTHAATKGYVDQAIPVGAMMEFAGPNPPAGWAICDGASKSTTDPAYVALFAVIGYTYGGASGSFNLPDMKGRAAVGRAAGDAVFGTLGQKGGTKDATVLLPHAHTVNNHTHDLSNHQHLVRHTHGLLATGGFSANHVHASTNSPNVFAHGQNGAVGHNAVPAGTGNTFLPIDQMNTGFANSDHVHNINIPEIQVWADGPNNNTSTGATPGTDVQQAGAAANANLAPYITLNYIIRIGV